MLGEKQKRIDSRAMLRAERFKKQLQMWAKTEEKSIEGGNASKHSDGEATPLTIAPHTPHQPTHPWPNQIVGFSRLSPSPASELM